MATRYDRDKQQWVTQFEQTGVRVFRRHPRGIGKPQAEAWEVKRRREIYDRIDLGKKPELTLGEAIDLWLHDNRRKNQRQAQSEAKQWEPWRGRMLRDAPEVAKEATKGWASLRSVSIAAKESPISNRTCATTGSRDRQALPASARAKPVASATTCAGGSEPNCVQDRALGRRSTTPTIPKPSTINRRLMMLKAVCKKMWLDKNTAENLSGRIVTLREPLVKERFLTQGEVRSIARCSSSATLGCAITTLAYTGLRATELTALTRSDLRRGTLSVLGKGDKRRAVPVPPIALPHARRAVPLGLSYWQLRKEFLRARKAAGIGKEVTLHTLRHTYASWFLQQGGDLYTLSKLMGHSTIYVTTRYGHLATEHLKAAVANLK